MNHLLENDYQNEKLLKRLIENIDTELYSRFSNRKKIIKMKKWNDFQILFISIISIFFFVHGLEFFDSPESKTLYIGGFAIVISIILPVISGVIRRNEQINHYEVKTRYLNIITFILVSDSKNINSDKKRELLSVIDRLGNFDELSKYKEEDFLVKMKINKLKEELKKKDSEKKEKS